MKAKFNTRTSSIDVKLTREEIKNNDVIFFSDHRKLIVKAKKAQELKDELNRAFKEYIDSL